MSTTTTWQVVGMTCGHCVAAVSAEIGAIEGVSDVRVTLETGAVEVDSDAPLAREAVAAAVDEAGYSLA
jgi:copper chaperone